MLEDARRATEDDALRLRSGCSSWKHLGGEPVEPQPYSLQYVEEEDGVQRSRFKYIRRRSRNLVRSAG